jgi:transposase-like protein
MGKNCPYCGSDHTQMKGSQNNRRRYRCIACCRQFQNHANRHRMEKIIWNEYEYQVVSAILSLMTGHLVADEIGNIAFFP